MTVMALEHIKCDLILILHREYQQTQFSAAGVGAGASSGAIKYYLVNIGLRTVAAKYSVQSVQRNFEVVFFSQYSEKAPTAKLITKGWFR